MIRPDLVSAIRQPVDDVLVAKEVFPQAVGELDNPSGGATRLKAVVENLDPVGVGEAVVVARSGHLFPSSSAEPRRYWATVWWIASVSLG